VAGALPEHGGPQHNKQRNTKTSLSGMRGGGCAPVVSAVAAETGTRGLFPQAGVIHVNSTTVTVACPNATRLTRTPLQHTHPVGNTRRGLSAQR